jgi:hypothetical protein
LANESDEAVDVLYDEVGDTEDGDVRGALLNLKRDAYNRRAMDGEDLDQVRGEISDAAWDAISTFREALGERDEVREDLDTTYYRELKDVRDKFREAIQNERFQKGLVISSPSLFEAQSSYLEAKVSGLSGKERSTERGLLRYLSRTAMKAAPFGTFCTVISGELADHNGRADDQGAENASTGSDGVLSVHGDLLDQHGEIRLDKTLYGLIQGRIQDRAWIRRRIKLDLNPTLRKVDGEFRFMAFVDGQEAFQRMPANPVLDLIQGILSTEGKKSSVEIAEILGSRPDVEASQNKILRYTDRLIQTGFLQLRFGISEQDVRWDRPLRSILKPIDDEWANTIVDLLATLRGKVDRYEAASLPERKQLLDAMEQEIDTALESMQWPEYEPIPFYEDATAPCSASLDVDPGSGARDALREYVEWSLPLSFPRRERVNARHFLNEYYENKDSVDLLTFYENFYRQYYKDHLDKKETNKGSAEYDLKNPFSKKEIYEIRKGRGKLASIIRERWMANPESDVIDIYSRDFEEATRDVKCFDDKPVSVSTFAQPYENRNSKGGGFLIKRGMYFAGYGKYFSRHLYLFRNKVENNIYDKNNSMAEGHVAEIRGHTHINMNLHPPITPKEISYPMGESGGRNVQLDLHDLNVEASETPEYGVVLKHGPSGREVHPVDLGFVSSKFRPPLYQFLTRFTPTREFIPPLPGKPRLGAEADEGSSGPETSEASTGEDDSGILYRPRIRFNESLLLTRKRWTVPRPDFPERRDDEDDPEYFARVNEWRSKHDIPNEVYVQIRPRSERRADDGETPEVEARRENVERRGIQEEDLEEEDEPGDERNIDAGNQGGRPQPKYRKPQYIDFGNPMLVNLFGTLTKDLSEYVVYLEERFPGSESLVEFEGETYTDELVLQVDLPSDR